MYCLRMRRKFSYCSTLETNSVTFFLQKKHLLFNETLLGNEKSELKLFQVLQRFYFKKIGMVLYAKNPRGQPGLDTAFYPARAAWQDLVSNKHT